MKQTAVEWLFAQMGNVAAGYETELNQSQMLEKAKEMEKQERHSEYMRGWKDGYSKQELKSE
jgi:hypothetical protein